MIGGIRTALERVAVLVTRFAEDSGRVVGFETLLQTALSDPSVVEVTAAQFHLESRSA
jgi:hypothetical protein